MNVQAKVALDKQKHPERYCPFYRCLWKTAKLNRATQQYEGDGYCPRHGGRDRQEPDMTDGHTNDVRFGGTLDETGE